MKYYSNKVIYSKVLKQNFFNLQTISGKKICAVIKANAYGHGAIKVANILKNNCDFFAVHNLFEAIEIRKINKTATILVLGYCIDYNLAIKNNISVTIDSLCELKKINKLNNKIKIHLKINTGMNRLGVKDLKEFEDILKYLKNNKLIIFEGIYTHFFNTKNKQITNKQINYFKLFLNKLNYFSPIIHVGGSGMVNYVNLDFAHYIRCGLSLFGYGQKFVRPCMKIKSQIIKITKIKKGEFVGYDCFYKAQKDIKIALIPLGYADGILRQFQDNMYVKINNQKAKVVGKICMDMFMVDITKISCKLGDKVVVFDNANFWAKKSGLSEYEVLTNLNNARTNVIISWNF